ncbi:MAG: alpha-L-fucosidase, partial [Clostridiales bacterium]|nr:alpha-L-fucosidase [Clostridiales bacterium]
EWAVGKAEECFPRNINFMLNLSPNINGRLDENQVKAFGEIGQKLRLPGAVGTLPPGWRMR